MDLIKPVYLRDREIQCGSTRISDFDLSMSVTKSISDLTCVQKDRDLWRIYVKSKERRSQILTEGIDIGNTNVKVYDTNPYITPVAPTAGRIHTLQEIVLAIKDAKFANMRVIYQATTRKNSTLNLKTMCFPSPGVITVFPIVTPVS